MPYSIQSQHVTALATEAAGIVGHQWRNCLSAHKHCAYLLAPKFLKMTIENPSDPPYNMCLKGSVLTN